MYTVLYIFRKESEEKVFKIHKKYISIFFKKIIKLCVLKKKKQNTVKPNYSGLPGLNHLGFFRKNQIGFY